MPATILDGTIAAHRKAAGCSDAHLVEIGLAFAAAVFTSFQAANAFEARPPRPQMPLGGMCDDLSASAHSTPSRADRNMIERASPWQICNNQRRRSGSFAAGSLWTNQNYLEA
jgi:hypothetical protein